MQDILQYEHGTRVNVGRAGNNAVFVAFLSMPTRILHEIAL